VHHLRDLGRRPDFDDAFHVVGVGAALPRNVVAERERLETHPNAS
jgi:hypothetical protein